MPIRAGADRVQTFLSRGAWHAGDLEDQVRDLVIEEMGDQDAVLIVDDTQTIKRGPSPSSSSPTPAIPARRRAKEHTRGSGLAPTPVLSRNPPLVADPEHRRSARRPAQARA